MKSYRIILNIIIILFPFALVFGAKTEKANEKFNFINEIYNESWALIIGINDYQNVKSLNYAEKDAQDFKNLLVANYGFKESNITLILNKEATKYNILAGFGDILKKTQKKDRVVVFYAGHGSTYELPSGGEMGFLVPVDGDPDDLYLTSIKMQEIYDLADMSYAKHILYLVDACYGGLAINSRGLDINITPEYLKKLTKERGRQVITAGGKNEEVIENPKWGHSAFTKNLLNGLGEDLLADENNDGIITAVELGGFIKNRVIIDVDGAHTPQQGRIGSDMGEFVFISETFKEELAAVDPDQLSEVQKELEAQKAQMKTQQKQMAELTELMLKQAQQKQNVESPGSYPKPTTVPKPTKPRKPVNMKTASTLAWMFPGMGHYYSGRTGKGLFYTSLELAALAGIAVTSSSYAQESENYNIALIDYVVIYNDVGATDDDVIAMQQAVTDAFNLKQEAMFTLIGAGTLSAGVWIWNILDVKKSQSKNYSSHDPVSIGINSRGQVEARLFF